MKSPTILEWTLPLDRTHNGIPLANGTQGLLVWGTTRICITIGRAGFWDRRGGNAFLSKTTYSEVKSLLQANDEQGLMEVFGRNTNYTDPGRPHQLGGGRLEIDLPQDWTVLRARLEPATGTIVVSAGKDGVSHDVRIRQAADSEWAQIELPEPLRACTWRLRPSWEWTHAALGSVNCDAPSEWQEGSSKGFLQTLPEDDPLAIAVERKNNGFTLTSSVGPDAEQQVRTRLDLDAEDQLSSAADFWSSYWQDVPSVTLPDPVLQEQVEYGLYMQACCTPPSGLACTLQGPLMECEGIPPWSNDYHFNINLQMIYTPALATNRAQHFEPLWNLIRSWLSDLRKSGSAFFRDSEALMLPHAVDDRCHVVGSFWTGSIDHGCTAWMALLCADYCRYTGDSDILRELAWPLLKGAWAGYRAMLEEADDGSMHLPVSVSPEYKGSRMDAWGADSSFQLAALHAVVNALPKVANELGESVDPEWESIRSRTPLFASERLRNSDEYPEILKERIVLWKGQDLDGSHRHHSHLAGITPFRTLDPHGEHEEVIRNSLHWWTYRGPGGWSGWCIPWAAMIHARSGQPDAAIHWLHTWNETFTNRGRASLHNANFNGVSTLGSNPHRQGDIMQLDGRFGCLSAVLELLVQDANNEIRVLPHIPSSWAEFQFDGILAPGGFVIGATVEDHRIREVRVTSLRGQDLVLRIGDGALITQPTTAGQSLRFAD